MATPLGATNSSPPFAPLLAMPLEAASGDLPKGESLDQPLTRPALDRQIERVLENPEFNWREPYLPAHSPSQKSLLDQLISSMRKTFLFIGNALNRLWKSLLKIFDFKHLFAGRHDARLATACRALKRANLPALGGACRDLDSIGYSPSKTQSARAPPKASRATRNARPRR